MYENKKRIVLLDGVIFNKKQLMGDTYCDWADKYDSLIDEDDNFMNQLRGSFCGIIIDKANGSITAFTNQSGEHTLYYSVDSNMCTIFSNIEIDEQGCLELLSVGGVLRGSTPYKSINRLTACKKMYFDNSKVSIENYHKFSSYPETDLTFEECIDKCDILFCQAVRRIFEKNIEYGYKNECDLSGGLDSRMAYFSARKM